MTSFLHNYILNVAIAFIILLLGGFVVDQAKHLYYAYAPIDYFYESGPMTAEDICLGDSTQKITSGRVVRGTDDGWPAIVYRELFLVERGMQTKVFEQVAYPFVEVAGNGESTRFQQIPDFIKVGKYQWVLSVTLVISGVERNDIPLIESNLFSVLDCAEDN